MNQHPPYPFTAVVNQDNLRLALLLSAVNRTIGGVLIEGGRGHGKRTIAQAFAALLPTIMTVTDCPFPFIKGDVPNDLWPYTAASYENSPAPFVILPPNPTETQLRGKLHLKSDVQRDANYFEAGLLANAHNGVLYVPRVDQLDETILQLILDTAASGLNIVERGGTSFSHPAQFIW